MCGTSKILVDICPFGCSTRHRSQNPSAGRPLPRALPGQHPAGVRGPAHQGHPDDAGRGGRLQDKGGSHVTERSVVNRENNTDSSSITGLLRGNFDLIATFRDALRGLFYPGILTRDLWRWGQGTFLFLGIL